MAGVGGCHHTTGKYTLQPVVICVMRLFLLERSRCRVCECPCHFTLTDVISCLLQVQVQTGPPEHVRTAVRSSRLTRRDSDDESSDFSD